MRSKGVNPDTGNAKRKIHGWANERYELGRQAREQVEAQLVQELAHAELTAKRHSIKLYSSLLGMLMAYLRDRELTPLQKANLEATINEAATQGKEAKPPTPKLNVVEFEHMIRSLRLILGLTTSNEQHGIERSAGMTLSEIVMRVHQTRQEYHAH